MMNRVAFEQMMKLKAVCRGGDTLKYLFELPDGNCIETVCIRRHDGATEMS